MPRKEFMRLMSGFREFREKFYESDDPHFSRLKNGWQGPKTLLIGCCDSRVDPAILSAAGPGDLFVVRNIANLVPPAEAADVGYHGVSAAIEYAVVNLKVENIVIMGHRQCGGIRALLFPDQARQGGFVQKWMKMAESAKERAIASTGQHDPDQLWRKCELESIRTSIQNLRTFPFVAEAVQQGTLSLIGMYFDIEAGQLLELNEATGVFSPLTI